MAGADFIAFAGSVIIPAGQTFAVLPQNVQTLFDTLAEGTETFIVNLTDVPTGNAVIGTGQRTGPILDLTVSINDVTVEEGDTVSFEVRLNHATTQDVSFTFTATSPVPYNTASTLTWTTSNMSSCGITADKTVTGFPKPAAQSKCRSNE